jgi:hypothetical protein
LLRGLGKPEHVVEPDADGTPAERSDAGDTTIPDRFADRVDREPEGFCGFTWSCEDSGHRRLLLEGSACG